MVYFCIGLKGNFLSGGTLSFLSSILCRLSTMDEPSVRRLLPTSSNFLVKEDVALGVFDGIDLLCSFFLPEIFEKQRKILLNIRISEHTNLTWYN